MPSFESLNAPWGLASDADFLLDQPYEQEPSPTHPRQTQRKHSSRQRPTANRTPPEDMSDRSQGGVVIQGCPNGSIRRRRDISPVAFIPVGPRDRFGMTGYTARASVISAANGQPVFDSGQRTFSAASGDLETDEEAPDTSYQVFQFPALRIQDRGRYYIKIDVVQDIPGGAVLQGTATSKVFVVE